MKQFLSNLILALFWAAINGEITLYDLLEGLVIGYGVLRVSRRTLEPARYFEKVWLFTSLVSFLVYSLVVASLRIAFDIITPGHHMNPGIVAVPLSVTTDEEISLLSSLISLTPGTLSLDVSQDRRILFVHVMYIDRGDVDAVRRKIKWNWERRVMELLR